MDDVTYIKTTATNAAGDTVDINDINSTNYNTMMFRKMTLHHPPYTEFVYPMTI